MRSNRYVVDRLDEVADRHFHKHTDAFADKAQFRSCLEECYALIARMECKKLKTIESERFWMSPEEFDAQNWLGGFKCFDGNFLKIDSDAFDGLFPRIREVGEKARRIPYSRLLKALAAEKIIVINRRYRVGGFPKSYLLHCDFVREAVRAYVASRQADEDADEFVCFNAHPSHQELMRKLDEARKIYKSLPKVGKMRVVLPDGWDDKKGVDEWGRFGFDGEGGLTVDELLRGLKLFNSRRRGHYKGGRYYDWFTSCSASFRRYIYIGRRHYRELIDLHSGFFWLFAIHGVRKGRVSVGECRSMISHCFSGTFYSDIAEAAKTGFVKTVFMRILNNSKRSITGCKNQVFKKHKSETFKKVEANLSKTYPEFMAFLNEEKSRYGKDIKRFGHELYYALAGIEREIMEALKKKIGESGYSIHFIRRVHDAIYGIQEISTIKYLLLDVIEEIIEQSLAVSPLESLS